MPFGCETRASERAFLVCRRSSSSTREARRIAHSDHPNSVRVHPGRGPGVTAHVEPGHADARVLRDGHSRIPVTARGGNRERRRSRIAPVPLRPGTRPANPPCFSSPSLTHNLRSQRFSVAAASREIVSAEKRTIPSAGAGATESVRPFWSRPVAN